VHPHAAGVVAEGGDLGQRGGERGPRRRHGQAGDGQRHGRHEQDLPSDLHRLAPSIPAQAGGTGRAVDCAIGGLD
jgi:hypothetical protein